MFTQTTLKPKRDYTKNLTKIRCAHGYTNAFKQCIECNPRLKCVCGSGTHRIQCCYGLELFKKRHAARMAHKGQQPQGPSISPPPLQPLPPPPAPLPLAQPEEPPPKMRKVMVGGIEMQVEEGSTMTIGGVSVVLG